MKRLKLKTYLTIPVFLGMLSLTGQVSADEAVEPPTIPTNPTVSTETAPTAVGVPNTPAPTNLPEEGTYTFTERSGVKAEPKVASPNLDYYDIGEKANYDETLEADNNLWISYTNTTGSRSFVAVGSTAETTVTPATETGSSPSTALETPAPTSQPETPKPIQETPVTQAETPKTAPATTGQSATQTAATSIPAKGTYTFTERVGVKHEPRLAAKNLDYYTPGEKVNYDRTLERENHLWLSYINFTGGRSYVAIKNLAPTAVATTPATSSQTETPKTTQTAPASQAETPKTAPTTTSQSATQTAATSIPTKGTYTFTERVGVKHEPRLAAKNLDYYTPGEKVNYDRTLERENHLWLSYINFTGGRSYVAIKNLAPTAVATTPAVSSQTETPKTTQTAPASQAETPKTAPATTGQSATQTAATSIPAKGTYTFTERVGVKHEPKLAAKNLDYYTPGEKVNYDRTLERENHLWLSYINFTGGRSYVAIKNLAPTAVATTPATSSQTETPKTTQTAPASQAETPKTAPATTGQSATQTAATSIPAKGTYTFTERVGVKHEPRLAAKNLDYYTPGEKVNYDRTLERENHLWLSYINFTGGRSYVAIKNLAPTAVATTPATSSQTETSKTTQTSPASQAETPKTASATTGQSATQTAATSIPAKGTYTFTERVGVKHEPKLAAKNLDYYTPGEKVNYDRTLERENHLWLSYINFTGGRSYVAIKNLAPTAVATTPAAASQTETPRTTSTTEATLPAKQPSEVKASAKIEILDYKESKPDFTVQVTGSAETKTITKVRVAVWSETNGQDDLKWYDPAVTNNQASTTVSVTNHANRSDDYHVHVYTTYTDNSTVETKLGTYKILVTDQVTADSSKITGPTVTPTEDEKKVTTTNQGTGFRIRSTEQTTSASQGDYANLTGTIFLDAGHGGYDSGAVYFGETEKALNMAIQEALMTRLIEAGYKVLLARSADKFVDLIDRSKLVNNTLSDLFISLHFNASSSSSVNGIESYYYQYEAGYGSEINRAYHNHPERLNRSQFLAEAIHKETVASTGAQNRGVRRESFAVLRETTAPAVLLELGYMSNPTELAKIRQKSYQEKLVDGIFKGIEAYYKRFF